MLTIDFVLSENDYLSLFLYRASQSKQLKDRRNKGWILIPAVFAMFAFVFYTDNTMPLAIMFACLAILYPFLYPIQVNKAYLNNLKKQTLPMLRYNFDKPVKIIFNESDITSFSFAGESKVYHSAINEVVETGSHFFIYIKTGNNFIIPKFGLIKIEAVENRLEEIVKQMEISYKKDLDFNSILSV